jgi:N-acetylglucosaminyl-diphospho-decaprenol L-rhamnosyltransferase
MKTLRVDLAVIIVNYKTPMLVVNCLGTLMSQLVGMSATVVVVDNNSKDNSINIIEKNIVDWPLECLTKIDLQSASINGGFAAGNNLGIDLVEADNYLLLNSDTLLRPGAIQIMLGAINASHSAGIVGPRLEYENGIPQQSFFRNHSIVTELVRGARLNFLTKAFKNAPIAYEVDETDADIKWISFACVLIKRAVFEKIGLLDEGYFMYFEDAEFCSRARAQGWRIVNTPGAKVVHLRGGSSSVKSDMVNRQRVPKYYYSSRTRYFYQHFGIFGLLSANLAWGLGRILSHLKIIVGKSATVGAKLEWIDIWTNFCSPLAINERVKNRDA